LPSDVVFATHGPIDLCIEHHCGLPGTVFDKGLLVLGVIGARLAAWAVLTPTLWGKRLNATGCLPLGLYCLCTTRPRRCG